MSPFSLAYNELLFRPLFNLLVGITNLLPGHNIGISILVVTLLVRLILLPVSWHQAKTMSKNQSKMGELKKELDRINKKYKNNQSKKAEETMRLYKEAGVNPASGCLPLLIQLPILIALYRVFLTGTGPETFSFLYSFVSEPTAIQLYFLGINLASPSVLLALMAGAFQLISMRLISSTSAPSTPGDEKTAAMMASMQKNMAYIFPVMTVFICLQIPAALALYWVASTLFGIGQQYYLKKRLNTNNIPAL